MKIIVSTNWPYQQKNDEEEVPFNKTAFETNQRILSHIETAQQKKQNRLRVELTEQNFRDFLEAYN